MLSEVEETDVASSLYPNPAFPLSGQAGQV